MEFDNIISVMLILTVRVFIGNLIITAADEPLEGVLEVVVEDDVDEGVDSRVGVGKHGNPELVLYKPVG